KVAQRRRELAEAERRLAEVSTERREADHEVEEVRRRLTALTEELAGERQQLAGGRQRLARAPGDSNGEHAGTSPRSGQGQYRLVARERLRVPVARLHAPQPGEAEKDLVVPPVAVLLGRVAGVQLLHLAPGGGVVQGQVDIWPGQVTVPLGDLVVQH